MFLRTRESKESVRALDNAVVCGLSTDGRDYFGRMRCPWRDASKFLIQSRTHLNLEFATHQLTDSPILRAEYCRVSSEGSYRACSPADYVLWCVCAAARV